MYASLIQKIEEDCNCSASFAAMFNKAALENSDNKPTCTGESLVCMEKQVFTQKRNNKISHTKSLLDDSKI